MKNTTICSPFEEPKRHFVFDREEHRITEEIKAGRQDSFYLAQKSNRTSEGTQQSEDLFENEIRKHDTINLARKAVATWKNEPAFFGTLTKTTEDLLAYWKSESRDPRLFFCQIEALETAIYLNEIEETDHRSNSNPLIAKLVQENKKYDQPFLRLAFKMATGTGKTLVMGMLIAYHFLNSRHTPGDDRFANSFLIITPNLTIKDRLEVLKPEEEGNYYKLHKLVPPGMLKTMKCAPVVVTNFHAFKLKDKGEGSSIVRKAANQQEDAFKETEKLMVDRVCKGLSQENILILNDEAHHCYPSKRDGDGEEKGTDREEKSEIEKRKKAAQLWMNGLRAIHRARRGARAHSRTQKTGSRKGATDRTGGVPLIYDLSATPFFLKGSGEPEGVIFPWVVSDFSLTEAIESGIVKIPIVPERDDPYRYLWSQDVRDKLNKEDALPTLIEIALHNIYPRYEKRHASWFEDEEKARDRGNVPPVFIVVCQNTKHSGKIRDFITKKFDLFRNEGKLYTILVDSQEMDSAEGISPSFRNEIRRQIASVKNKRAEQVDDEEILRTMMNTVGKKGEQGAEVRCVVSVSMLTEGWDANNVTHVLGIRAFSTQLLCEQVVGRALRRTSYALEPRDVDCGNGRTETIDLFTDEYAEIFGVPFDMFFPAASNTDFVPIPPKTTHVHSMAERSDYEIWFPLVEGYVRTFPPDRLSARFSEASQLDLPARIEAPTTRVAALVGPSDTRVIEPTLLMGTREATVAYILAHELLNRHFKPGGHSVYGDGVEGWRFPNILQIVRDWMKECVTTSDSHFIQLLLLEAVYRDALRKIYDALEHHANEDGQVSVQLKSDQYIEKSTSGIAFDTAKPVMKTRKSHLSHVVADTLTWEQMLATTLENMGKVLCYVKNDVHLDFAIPYVFQDKGKNYHPDFIACIDDGHGKENPLNLILEVSGPQAQEIKAQKVETTRKLWLPAINRLERFGRWDFIELRDAKYFESELRSFLQNRSNHKAEAKGD